MKSKTQLFGLYPVHPVHPCLNSSVPVPRGRPFGTEKGKAGLMGARPLAARPQPRNLVFKTRFLRIVIRMKSGDFLSHPY